VGESCARKCYASSEPEMTTKQQILHAMGELPEEASIEDAVERLHLLFKIERGLEQADAGKTVTQEEARARMARWLP
jgi:predicted transcriptional regulator